MTRMSNCSLDLLSPPPENIFDRASLSEGDHIECNNALFNVWVQRTAAGDRDISEYIGHRLYQAGSSTTRRPGLVLRTFFAYVCQCGPCSAWQNAAWIGNGAP